MTNEEANRLINEHENKDKPYESVGSYLYNTGDVHDKLAGLTDEWVNLLNNQIKGFHSGGVISNNEYIISPETLKRNKITIKRLRSKKENILQILNIIQLIALPIAVALYFILR